MTGLTSSRRSVALPPVPYGSLSPEREEYGVSKFRLVRVHRVRCLLSAGSLRSALKQINTPQTISCVADERQP